MLILAVLFPVARVDAEIISEAVQYRDGDVDLKGQLFWDDADQSKRPGVMVVHEWWGLNDYAVRRARMLAELGYVAFAADMYGAGKVTKHPDQADKWMKQLTGDTKHWQERAQAGLTILKKHPKVDTDKLAAIGYCFGGGTVMQMAYAGTDLRGVVSFHGSLPVASGEQKTNIRAKILVAHGAADSFVSKQQMQYFRSALEQADADWEINIYSGAFHSFTNPDANNAGVEGLKYDKQADLRSWERMRDFFEEIF